MQRFKRSPIVVTGYPGTRLGAAAEVLKKGFKPSHRPWEWLGRGIYFWQDAPVIAYRWAKDWLGRKGYQGPIAVLPGRLFPMPFAAIIQRASPKSTPCGTVAD